MDPVSQAALGAVVGQIAGHRRLGLRAAAVGALAGAAPDIDVLFSIGGDWFDQLVLHRGITHSLFFAPVAGPLLGWLVWRIERARDPSLGADASRLKAWMAVVVLALLSHPLLDAFTPYGTQLLLPFSDARFAVNAMPIIDPAYTLLLCAGLWIAVRPLRARARAVAWGALLASSAYLAFGWWLNAAAEREAARQLAEEGIADARVAAFPTILQVHYRRLVVRTAAEDRVGYLSMWRPCPIVWQRGARYEGPEVASFLASREGRIFDWFTMGWIRFQRASEDGQILLRAIDLRYGFTPEVDQSIFETHARVHPTEGTLGPVHPAGADRSDAGERLAGLFQEAYAPFCSVG